EAYEGLSGRDPVRLQAPLPGAAEHVHQPEDLHRHTRDEGQFLLSLRVVTVVMKKRSPGKFIDQDSESESGIIRSAMRWRCG
ncbi:hypothetical protein THAOC_23845, partial [Thalassiosira oceanica]